jgi:hypothetical protein
MPHISVYYKSSINKMKFENHSLFRMPLITPSFFVSFVNNFCNNCAIIINNYLNSTKEGKSSVIFATSRTGERLWSMGYRQSKANQQNRICSNLPAFT